MREPYLTQFTQAILRGAASRDIHDSDGVGGYDATLSSGVSAEFLQRELQRVEMHTRCLCAPLTARLGRAVRILDAGCGTGGTTVALALSALRPQETVGFDACNAALEAARLRALGHGLSEERARFVHVPAGEQLPFESASFDLVTCVSVLEFISEENDRAAFVRELLRVTKPGGYVYLATPNPLSLHEQHSRRWFGNWRRQPGFPWASTGAALRRMFSGCLVRNMAAERIRHHPRWHYLSWVAPVVSWLMPWQRYLARKP